MSDQPAYERALSDDSLEHLTTDQIHRVLCLQVALSLVAGRDVLISTVRQIAQWIYDGGDS